MAAVDFFPGFAAGRFTADDGTGIHYVTGGSGPPLLLLHGAPQSHIMWRHQAPKLAERFTLVLPDLRGYGRSDKPARGDYSKRRSAADMAALMTSLGHPTFRVAGHDRGARVARRLMKDHRDRVERGILLDIVPTTHIYRNMDYKVASNLWIWVLLPRPEPLPETMLDPRMLIAGGAKLMGDDPDALADYLETNGNAESLHTMCEDYRAGASVDMAHDDADADRPIEAPLLILWGSRSLSTAQLFDVPAAWAGQAANATFRAIDSDHFLPEEAPEATLKAMLEFL